MRGLVATALLLCVAVVACDRTQDPLRPQDGVSYSPVAQVSDYSAFVAESLSVVARRADFVWRHVADLEIRGEGPCANTWAQGNAAGPVAVKRVYDESFFGGPYVQGAIGTDLEPRGTGLQEVPPGHFFGGTLNFILYRYVPNEQVWPPPDADRILYGVGFCTYNLQYRGVADELQFDCTSPITGTPFRLVTPIFDYSVPIQDWPWLTLYVPGSTYSFVQCQLWVASGSPDAVASR